MDLACVRGQSVGATVGPGRWSAAVFASTGHARRGRKAAVCLRDVGDHWVAANLLVLIDAAIRAAKQRETNKYN